jgi:ATP/ADP translocase
MRHVWRSRHIKHLVLIAAAGAFAAVMIDFQFYATAAAADRSSGDNASYFAKVYLLVNAAALALQLSFGARLQRHLGIAGALLILPLVLLGGSAVLVLGASHATGVGLRLTEGGLRASIHRSNWEQSFIGIAQRERTIAKVLVDGLSARFGSGLAALLLYGWLELVVPGADMVSRTTTWIGAAIVASTIVWLIATIRLREVIKPGRAEEEPRPFAPAPLPDCCATTAARGAVAYVKSR